MVNRSVAAGLVLSILGTLLAGCAFRGAYTVERIPTDGPPRVDAPPAEIGRAWSYRLVNGYNSEVLGQYREELVAGANQDLNIVRTDTGRAESITERYTSDWKWVSKARPGFEALDYSPPLPAIPFPLEIGKSWRYRSVSSNRLTGERFPVSVHGRIVGWEKLKTPAGNFDTVRIDRVIYVDDADFWKSQTRITESDWYAPSVGRVVRSENTSGYYALQMVSRAGVQWIAGNWNVLELAEPVSAR